MPQMVHFQKSDLSNATLVDLPASSLAEGAVRLRVEGFAVTANNITYAVIGDMFQYWDFFPAPGGQGIVPMWGHAVVEASNHADIAIGERVYGYLPMGSHLDVLPGNVSAGGFADVTAYRQPMAVFYNQYSRLAADPEHDPAREDARMIFGPLFKTGFLIEAFMRREGWFGAEACLLTSASSKTAMALAHCIREESPHIRRIGLTSSRNMAFVEGCGLYDAVLNYDSMLPLPQIATVSVDFAGNAAVLRAIHEDLSEALKYSCTVGVTHVDARAGSGDPLPGPTPTLFFAPSEAVAIVKALGPQGFAAAVGQSWAGFVDTAERFVRVDHRDGLGAARDAFLETLAGTADPAVGIVVRP